MIIQYTEDYNKIRDILDPRGLIIYYSSLQRVNK